MHQTLLLLFEILASPAAVLLLVGKGRRGLRYVKKMGEKKKHLLYVHEGMLSEGCGAEEAVLLRDLTPT